MNQDKQQEEWISTGTAAKILGYKSRDAFRMKLKGVIRTLVLPSGHLRWDKAEVLKLRDDSVIII